MKSDSGKKKTVEKIKVHILCKLTLFFENRAVYEIIWKKKNATAKQGTEDNIMRRIKDTICMADI